MKFSILARVLAFMLLGVGTAAFAKKQPPADYQQGTVMKVDRKEVQTPDNCCYSGTDTPIQNQYYAYEVTVRVGCTDYVGRYESYLDFFPSAISPGKSVQVRPEKHDLYFETPIWSDGRVPIVRRVNNAASCGTDTGH